MRYRAINYSKKEAKRQEKPLVMFNPFHRINNTNTFKELRSTEPSTLTKMDEVSGVFLCFYNSSDGKERMNEYMLIPETHPLFNYLTALYSTDRYPLRNKLREFMLPEATKLAELFP